MGLNSPLVQVASDEDRGLYFIISEPGKPPVRVAFEFKERNLIGNRSDLLARAIGYKAKNKENEAPSLRVLDATAGLCRDAFHMASLGCEVLALEENAMLFEVLSFHIGKLVADYKLSIKHYESKKFMREYLESASKPLQKFDVVYLDPMFPEKKKTAKSGKESILLKLLAPISKSENEMELFKLARAVAARRVVVKRPLHAPSLSLGDKMIKPTAQFKGKSVRYDVYISALTSSS